MKKIFLLQMLLFSGLLIYSQPLKDKIMPVTTGSHSALSLYVKAKKYYDDVHLDKAIETFTKALDQDPDFFMANYQLALFYLLNKSEDDFNSYAKDAINCKEKLSDAENILKDVLISFSEGHIDVTDLGKKLVAMYPDDPEAYNNLASFQSLVDNTQGMVETLEKAVKVASDPAPFYNQLGYAYLALKENDKAGEAFDKYIELDPGNPNVYDSKGDYYLYMKKYELAYNSYMKAYGMDHSFSRDKAEMARKLYEQSEGKSLNIITM
jgi:tetratricopeptide (TPR) repeat protein